jgi:hypothetical protein
MFLQIAVAAATAIYACVLTVSGMFAQVTAGVLLLL